MYLAKIKMNLLDGKNIQESSYWWRNGAILGDNILEAFEFYLEGRLTPEFESCRDAIEASTKINVTNKIIKLKRKF